MACPAEMPASEARAPVKALGVSSQGRVAAPLAEAQKTHGTAERTSNARRTHHCGRIEDTAPLLLGELRKKALALTMSVATQQAAPARRIGKPAKMLSVQAPAGGRSAGQQAYSVLVKLSMKPCANVVAEVQRLQEQEKVARTRNVTSADWPRRRG